MYGKDVTYHGKIAGLGAGSGAAFALLPPQNASGNWIKIVQRVPVRISLDPKELAEHPLRLGLSMKVDVDMHDTSGSLVATQIRSAPQQITVSAEQDAKVDLKIADIIKRNGRETAAFRSVFNAEGIHSLHAAGQIYRISHRNLRFSH